MDKLLIPIVVLALVFHMGNALASTQSCKNSEDCKYDDETCVYVGESEGKTGECVREGSDLEHRIESDNETEAPYEHGTWCIDGRIF